MERIPLTGGKNGSKRNLLVEKHDLPLSLTVTAANHHDSTCLEALLESRCIDPPESEKDINLCLDAAYVGKGQVVNEHGYIPHIRPRGEEKLLIERNPSYKARRWVVEASHSHFNRYRKLVPRYEKTDLSHIALTTLAAAMITLNKVMIIYG